MSAREWLIREIQHDVEGEPDVGFADEPWFDSSLSAALDVADLSERSIDLLVELAEPDAARPATLARLLVSDPSIAARREALGISTAEAARDLGISEAGYGAIERVPLRWETVTDAARLSRYLSRLEVPRGVFLRWLASLRPAATGLAWGYRPGAVLDRPVDTTPDDSAHFLSWGSNLLREPTAPESPTDSSRLFGYAWSPQATADRSSQILRAAQARLLATDVRNAPPDAPRDAVVIALDSPTGVVYPDFQFDSNGRLPGIVAEVNTLLGAGADPWGVADWWLTEDESLGVPPADLVEGTETDHDRLRGAARRLLEADW